MRATSPTYVAQGPRGPFPQTVGWDTKKGATAFEMNIVVPMSNASFSLDAVGNGTGDKKQFG